MAALLPAAAWWSGMGLLNCAFGHHQCTPLLPSADLIYKWNDNSCQGNKVSKAGFMVTHQQYVEPRTITYARTKQPVINDQCLFSTSAVCVCRCSHAAAGQTVGSTLFSLFCPELTITTIKSDEWFVKTASSNSRQQGEFLLYVSRKGNSTVCVSVLSCVC